MATITPMGTLTGKLGYKTDSKQIPTSYNDLPVESLPSINGVKLQGDKQAADLRLQNPINYATPYDIEKIILEEFK